MVSKRQKQAKQSFKAAHPELFPTPEPTPPKDPTRKKKKFKSKFKKKIDDSAASKDPSKRKSSSFRKHPLRIPGMRPGDSCYICKANDHIAKNCPEKAQWEKNKICLQCRHRGHSLKNCPNKGDVAVDKKLCYNCGESGHSLDKCPQPLQDGGTKYASCFVCNEKGHLSKNCPKNTHGIYPKGGSCKECGGVTHLAKDCPNKGTNTVRRGHESIYEMSRGQITKFTSGDDLEDDFMLDINPIPTSVENSSSLPKATPVAESKDNLVKPKKTNAPKVVTFVG